MLIRHPPTGSKLVIWGWLSAYGMGGHARAVTGVGRPTRPWRRSRMMARTPRMVSSLLERWGGGAEVPGPS